MRNREKTSEKERKERERNLREKGMSDERQETVETNSKAELG